jgi:hypothetical protein
MVGTQDRCNESVKPNIFICSFTIFFVGFSESDRESDVSDYTNSSQSNDSGEPENGILDFEDTEDEAEDNDGSDEDEDDDDVVVESSEVFLSTLRIVKLVAKHPLNKAIRICGKWYLVLELKRSKSLCTDVAPFHCRLQDHPDVLSEAVKEGSSLLWVRLSQFFNAVALSNPAYEQDDQVRRMVKDFKKVTFVEDTLVQGLKVSPIDEKVHLVREVVEEVCKDFYLHIRLGIYFVPFLQGVARVMSFCDLRNWLCRETDAPLTLAEDDIDSSSKQEWLEKVNLVPFGKPKPRLEKNNCLTGEEKSKTGVPAALRTGSPKASSSEVEVAKLSADEEQEEQKRLQMMKNMAHLWLQQEVRVCAVAGNGDDETLI